MSIKLLHVASLAKADLMAKADWIALSQVGKIQVGKVKHCTAIKTYSLGSSPVPSPLFLSEAVLANSGSGNGSQCALVTLDRKLLTSSRNMLADTAEQGDRPKLTYLIHQDVSLSRLNYTYVEN